MFFQGRIFSGNHSFKKMEEFKNKKHIVFSEKKVFFFYKKVFFLTENYFYFELFFRSGFF